MNTFKFHGFQQENDLMNVSESGKIGFEKSIGLKGNLFFFNLEFIRTTGAQYLVGRISPNSGRNPLHL